ncbi:MAG: M24 family metallopeptidase, partial [Desulfovibrio sp.]|nr:M24 family metallopeptidase [Desulfovibrio sp.]
DDWLATDARYLEAARALWPENRILVYRNASAPDIARLLCRCGAMLGFEGRGVSWSHGQKLKGLLRPGHCLLPADGLVEKLRVIKEPCEIAALEKSFLLNHQMFAWLENRLAAGELASRNEKTLAWEIEKFFRDNGAQELAFDTIAATGKNGARPHAIPGARIFAANEPVLVDAGCRVDDYCSDQTRTWWHGPEPSADFEKTLGLVRSAQEAALAMMAPGVPCADVYKAATQVFIDAGVEKAFTHGLGHGVGLQTHEAPSLSPFSSQILAENMVVTVEPGLYYPDWGGVRWENTVLIEKNGIRIL